ncbi:MAG TPA: DMT family transporter [Anaerovoracaceae bacterium]|nr:DMT family transporter [Anaerovoracaceae bacterium]
MNKKKITGIAMIFGTTIGYALVPSFSFLAFDQGVATETLLFNKYFYAAVLMWAYIVIKRLPVRLPRETIPMMVAICLAYISLATTLYFAFDYISGSLATIVSFTFPAMIVAIEMITGREKVRLTRILAVVISMVGLIFIVWSPDISANIIGILFAFGTALSYVAYMFGLDAKRIRETNSLVVSGYVLLASAIFNLFRCSFSGKPLFTTGFNQLWLMLALAIFCAFMAILFFCIGIKLIGPGNAAIINTFEPALACFFGYTIIGDVLTPNMIIGSGFIVMAVLIANWKVRDDS